MAKKDLDQINLLSDILYAILESNGPSKFAIALHNASCHGKCFKKNFAQVLDDDDNFLKDWFKSLEHMIEAGNGAEMND